MLYSYSEAQEQLSSFWAGLDWIERCTRYSRQHELLCRVQWVFLSTRFYF